jgi:UDP-glucose 4-epimerase
MSTILVTGAAGYVGSVCVEVLLERGHDVIAVDNLQGGNREAVLPPARLVQADLCAAADLRQLFARDRVEAVMHFAALADVPSSLREPHPCFRNNVCGTLNLLEAMLCGGVRNLVFSSSAAVYGEPRSVPIAEHHPKRPLNPYGESKLVIERMLRWYARCYGLRVAALRYFNAAGATVRLGEDRAQEGHLIPSLLDVALGKGTEIAVYGGDLATGDGSCIRDYVHVLDIVSAHLLCLEHIAEFSYEAFNVGCGEGRSVLQVLAAARRVTGHPIPAQVVGPRPGDPAALVASPQKISARLGWAPQHSSLQTILQDAWAWRRAHPQGYRSREAALAGAALGSG